MQTKSNINYAAIFLSLFLLVFLCAAIGLGVWSSNLNKQTGAVRDEEATLQKQYDDLTADKNAVNAELDKTKSDLEKAKAALEKAKADLTSAQESLAKVQEEKTALQDRVDKALKCLDVASAFWVDGKDYDDLESEVDAVGDDDLSKEYGGVNSGSDFVDWLGYLFRIVTDLLNVQ